MVSPGQHHFLTHGKTFPAGSRGVKPEVPEEKNREKKPGSIFLLSLPDLPLRSSELRDLHKAHKIILPGCDFSQNFQNIGTDPLDFAGWTQQPFHLEPSQNIQDVEETKWKMCVSCRRNGM